MSLDGRLADLTREVYDLRRERSDLYEALDALSVRIHNLSDRVEKLEGAPTRTATPTKAVPSRPGPKPTTK